MKIIHTSDLHIGKRLHQADLMDDQAAFFHWLINLIKEQSVDALLISGDVFDVANPSSEARKLYYEFLVRLSELKCKVIITGGNHDSPAVLEAPKEVLKALEISVVGSQPDDLFDQLIEISDKKGQQKAVVAAVPFLRDRDLRKRVEDEIYEDRVEAIKKGIAKTYREVAKLCEQNYPGIPAIAMGHLYINKAKISESERDIHIGNLAGLDAELLPDYFQYIALGHLHRPQETDAAGKIVYSGSPYPLSFSEKENRNRVLLLNIEDREVRTESIEVPSFRKLVKFSGTLEEVLKKLHAFKKDSSPFTSLIEIEVIEESSDPAIANELELAIGDFTGEDARVVKYRIQFTKEVRGTDELYTVEKNIEELSPKDVFLKKIEYEDLSETSKQLLIEAFEEIVDMVNLNENA